MRIETVKKKLEGAELPSGVRFYSRLGVFKNSRNTMGFDPVSLEGHSYGWWVMTRSIKGQVILNTYSYSNQTAKHINKARRILSLLGIPFKTLESPRGLQDLEGAARHHAYSLAEIELKNQYKRRGSRDWSTQTHVKALNTLKQLGIKVTKSLLTETQQLAILHRQQRLTRQRERAAILRNRARVKFIDATPEDAHKIGMHHISKSHSGYISQWDRDQLLNEALSKGFETVWIHKRGLRLVSA